MTSIPINTWTCLQNVPRSGASLLHYISSRPFIFVPDDPSYPCSEVRLDYNQGTNQTGIGCVIEPPSYSSEYTLHSPEGKILTLEPPDVVYYEQLPSYDEESMKTGARDLKVTLLFNRFPKNEYCCAPYAPVESNADNATICGLEPPPYRYELTVAPSETIDSDHQVVNVWKIPGPQCSFDMFSFNMSTPKIGQVSGLAVSQQITLEDVMGFSPAEIAGIVIGSVVGGILAVCLLTMCIRGACRNCRAIRTCVSLCGKKRTEQEEKKYDKARKSVGIMGALRIGHAAGVTQVPVRFAYGAAKKLIG